MGTHDVLDIEVGDNATIHAVVLELSPVRPSENNPDIRYFRGKLSDGKKTARLISFEPNLRPSLERSREDKKPVALVSCKIQEGKFDSNLEIVTSKHTKVESSPKKFKVDDTSEASGVPDITIDEVVQLTVNQVINVVGKVVQVNVATEVTSKQKGKPLFKQDCIISDAKGSIRIVLWQNDTDKLKEGLSYRLNKVLIRQYSGVKYLSFSEDASVDEVPDIGEVVSADDLETREDQQQTNYVAEGEITAVLSVDDYISCVSCKGKVKALSEIVGECLKCCAKVKMSRCGRNTSVKFVVEGSEDKSWRLTAFKEQVDAIVSDQQGNSIEDKMLSAPPMKFYYTSTNIVKAIRKIK